jgi:hypothetical protein
MKVRLAVGLALSLLAVSLSAQAQDVAPVTPPDYSPGPPNEVRYDGRREAINCPDFATQADAQAFLRAYPSDPSELDTDRNGIACELNFGPTDMVPVQR